MKPEALVLETEHRFDSGARLPIRLGAESYGRLNARRDNAVLICHYYTGTMHAAGRYSRSELEQPGWWDALIGPGRAIDTDRFFVVCLNTPANVQSRDPRVITSGPDTAAPDGQPWGARFPDFGLGDVVELQRALMQQLGIRGWYAVLGPSLGGMQTLHWGARYPELAPRLGIVAAAPQAGAAVKQAFYPLLELIGRCAPDEPTGLREALRLISFFGLGSDGLRRNFEIPDLDFETYLGSRAQVASLQHILAIGRMVCQHDLEVYRPLPETARMWAARGTRVLTVAVRGDQFFSAGHIRAFAGLLAHEGVSSAHLEVDSELGHLACVSETVLFEAAVRELLA
ncbi:homoserine O-acetyltransferase [Deinobacterium chartae]|uniref:Homoserine O-acetyltransferase n=1 Tax=Deinobacterium chartae TaxID=521158 RepID=A0A841I4E0_9DEIO|nr:alpha/beta fold hydrolase [Deinobacterium chartae]MBB6098852.1 homoserine O-acetyltransferase [Deinobacterium chartae]